MALIFQKLFLLRCTVCTMALFPVWVVLLVFLPGVLPAPAHCQGRQVCLSQEDRGVVLVFYGGAHQPVCDDSWDQVDADVACRQAGFMRGALTATTGNDARGLTYIMDEVGCTGGEKDLLRCAHQQRHDCGTQEAAGAVCDSTTREEEAEEEYKKQTCFAIGVSYSPSNRIGEEVTLATSVGCQQHCANNTDCTQFGFNPTTKTCHIFSATDKVPANVYEIAGPRLCPSNPTHLESECLEGICLLGEEGRSETEGNVFLSGRPVCDDSWGEDEARVTCRHLNYTGALRYTVGSKFGLVVANFSSDSLQCEGSEEELTVCRKRLGKPCDSGEAAGVTCDTREEEVVEREWECFTYGLAYRGDNNQSVAASAEECRGMCTKVQGCSHFTWFFQGGKCETFCFQDLKGKIFFFFNLFVIKLFPNRDKQDS